ncbi:alpha/beta hydrolase [Candidatus Saccharibacteria bacterium]|nr:alpha/beta hydrolase [Candidatus Saccharibacteria bacterium]
MDAVREKLSDDFEVLSPDLPGTGDNPELSVQDLAGHLKWLHSYIEDLGVKPILVGHSMGSIIVSHYVEKYPETVGEKVVLMSPILRGPGAKVAGRVLDGALKGLLWPFGQEQRTKILASKQVSWTISHYLTSDKTKQKEITELHYKYGGSFASSRSLYGDMQVSMENDTKMPKDKQILVIFGKKDRLSNHKLARARAEQAGAEYCELLDCGHLINYERPQEVAERIKQFLK